jgi:hypothetical protein
MKSGFLAVSLTINLINMMKSFLFAIAISAIATACQSTQGSENTESNAPDSAAMVKRGEYLVNTIGCDDCHSPKEMGPQGPQLVADRRLSGYPSDRPLPPIDSANMNKGWMLMFADLTAAVGPWGVSFASNITGDETGIGSWTEAQFINAMRKGKFKGLDTGRDLLPPMPWQNFGKLTDEDLKSIFAFLKTTKPVKNIAPEPRRL